MKGDNSREAPGKQDTIKVTIDGSKITCQKNICIAQLINFNLFKEKYPNIKIGRSKFSELSPPYVLLSSAMQTRACACRYHENFMLLLDELHKVNKTIPTYSKEFIQSLVCNPESKLCWKNLCNKYKDSSLLDQYYVSNNRILSWFSWQNAILPNGKKKLKKLSFQGSFDDAFSELKLQTSTFLIHHFVTEKQSAAFKIDCDFSDTNFDTAVLQIDFAENYSTFYQDEVQSTHWVKTQITIFTTTFWQKNKCHPAVVVSDVSHSKQCILIFVGKILQSLLMDSVKTVHIWSDGLSSQFKNWYFAAALPWLQAETDIQTD